MGSGLSGLGSCKAAAGQLLAGPLTDLKAPTLPNSRVSSAEFAIMDERVDEQRMAEPEAADAEAEQQLAVDDNNDGEFHAQKFPSIKQFRHLLENIPYAFRQGVPPTLTFRGTVKLHGTNASLLRRYAHANPAADGRDDEQQQQASNGSVNAHGDVVIQSRNRTLTLESDNLGCAAFMHKQDLDGLFQQVEDRLTAAGRDLPKTSILIAGEFCGGNIQRHVALYKLPKMFVIFAIAVDGRWLDLGGAGFSGVQLEHQRIFNIMSFPQYRVELQTEHPEAAQRELEQLTADVDRECPVALQLAGERGPGEGIVWTCVERPECSMLWFKTKGTAHCTAADGPKAPKVRTSIPLEVEKAAGVDELLARCVTPARLQQGLDYLVEMGHGVVLGSLLTFSRWVVADVFKEEADTIRASNVAEGQVRKEAHRLAVLWFKNKVQELQDAAQNADS